MIESESTNQEIRQESPANSSKLKGLLKSPVCKLMIEFAKVLSFIVSAVVMILILCTYNLQKDYYYALISPDIDIDLTAPPEGSEPVSGVKFIQKEAGSDNFQIWFRIRNVGEQPFDTVRVGLEYDTLFDDRIIRASSAVYYLPSGSEYPVARWHIIPAPTENPELGFVYTTVYFRTALQIHYRFEKVFGIQWSSNDSKEWNISKVWIEKTRLTKL